eukprot:gb/GECH01012513.1/.p1 GENE.gb/GECH01012513.1/~~gb/GECH01012513.1/.p1  ORF type:complete len:282 (+),score=84.19 gb/GECH01012513.1/:1-846(+)
MIDKTHTLNSRLVAAKKKPDNLHFTAEQLQQLQRIYNTMRTQNVEPKKLEFIVEVLRKQNKLLKQEQKKQEKRKQQEKPKTKQVSSASNDLEKRYSTSQKDQSNNEEQDNNSPEEHYAEPLGDPDLLLPSSEVYQHDQMIAEEETEEMQHVLQEMEELSGLFEEMRQYTGEQEHAVEEIGSTVNIARRQTEAGEKETRKASNYRKALGLAAVGGIAGMVVGGPFGAAVGGSIGAAVMSAGIGGAAGMAGTSAMGSYIGRRKRRRQREDEAVQMTSTNQNDK